MSSMVSSGLSLKLKFKGGRIMFYVKSVNAFRYLVDQSPKWFVDILENGSSFEDTLFYEVKECSNEIHSVRWCAIKETDKNGRWTGKSVGVCNPGDYIILDSNGKVFTMHTKEFKSEFDVYSDE